MAGDAAVKKEEASANGDSVTRVLLTKPGQKYPTPTPGVAERIFYETLYQQNPDRCVRVWVGWVVVGGLVGEGGQRPATASVVAPVLSHPASHALPRPSPRRC